MPVNFHARCASAGWVRFCYGLENQTEVVPVSDLETTLKRIIFTSLVVVSSSNEKTWTLSALE
jgi:hypothetical protein